jgi:lipopolysaccharide export system permease protein
MWILDRHIAVRFLANFVLLFAILFIFGMTIDVIIQLDDFTKAATQRALEATPGADAPASWRFWLAFVEAIVDYHGPKVAQFYAYLLGLVSVGAAGFTLAQMVRTRELVAILASGTSLVRVGMVILVAATGLNLLQLVNQELILPRLAPLLIRPHNAIFKGGLRDFPIHLTRDSRGQLLWGRTFNPLEGRITGFLLIERDGNGAALARTQATSATWNSQASRWELEGGARSLARVMTAEGEDTGATETTPVDFAATDLSARALTIRQYGQFAQMLSLQQLREMRDEGGVDVGEINRLTYLRLGSILVNLLVLVAALPFFLLREPTNLLRQSVLCALFAVPGTLGSLVAMTASLPGLPPAVNVFLPAAVLLPIAFGRFGTMKT